MKAKAAFPLGELKGNRSAGLRKPHQEISTGLRWLQARGQKNPNNQPDSAIALKAFATNFQLYYNISSDSLLRVVTYTHGYCNSEMAMLKMALNAILCYLLVDTYIYI